MPTQLFTTRVVAVGARVFSSERLFLPLIGAILATAPMHGQDLRAGAYVSYLLPVGTLQDRFFPTVGGSVTFGMSDGSPAWFGSFEYIKFDRENTDELAITRTVNDGGQDQEYSIPLTKLSMDLEIVGVALNGTTSLWNAGSVDIQASAGFGVYHWNSYRSAYQDSMKAQTPSGPVLVEVLDVPESEQEDWSGGLQLGLDVRYHLGGPMFLTAGARYKIVIGELWPALSLDLENVSGMQMIDIRAGVSAVF
jgi:hypothetical protein